MSLSLSPRDIIFLSMLASAAGRKAFGLQIFDESTSRPCHEVDRLSTLLKYEKATSWGDTG